ncbi:MAG: CoA transferase [Alphaproteobacteria bacterium]|nr:CoA transferase [Alphaproteobacteria bacterium]
MSYRFPYEGLRVLDVSQGFAGPYAGGLLSLYGASVVKVEPPGGDWIREIGRVYDGITPLGLVANRGKRSIALDLKTEDGRGIVHRLARDADIFIESFRPGVAARLGIDYAAISRINPRVLYLSVSGFGQTGPNTKRPATDTVIQAHSGFMSVNKGMDGVPHRSGALVADTATGIYAFQAVAAALYAREKEEAGRHIDVNLMQGTAAFLAPKIVEHHLEHGEPRSLNAPAGSYRTRDGWIAVTLVKEDHFARICRAMGREELIDDPRFVDFAARGKNEAELRTLVGDALSKATTESWVERFTRHEVLCNAINGFDDWLADPQVVASTAAPMLNQPGMGPTPVPTIPGTDPAEGGPDAPAAPAVGEHGRQILEELGFDNDSIEGLIRDRVVHGIA